MQQHRRPDPDCAAVHSGYQHLIRCRNRAQKAEPRAVRAGWRIGEKVVQVVAGAEAIPRAAEQDGPDRLIDFGLGDGIKLRRGRPSKVASRSELPTAARTRVAERIEQDASIFMERLRPPEFQEAANAFLEKRALDFPRFS